VYFSAKADMVSPHIFADIVNVNMLICVVLSFTRKKQVMRKQLREKVKHLVTFCNFL